MVRGLALVGMIVFHLAWDFHALGITGLDPSRSPAWHIFGHAVASCFLLLSGFSLVLAKDRGATAKSSLKRIGVISSAAFVVTLATWFVAPNQVITFGILHCIALSNLIALALLRAPRWLVVLVALAALAAPLAFEPVAPRWTWWMGLLEAVPDTLDNRPLCPWLSLVLAGCLFARHGGTTFMANWDNRGGACTAILTTAGRHSLAIYLGHQPIIFALLLLVTALHVPAGSQLAARWPIDTFTNACIEDCIGAGASPDLCKSTCQCVARQYVSGRSPPVDWHHFLSSNQSLSSNTGISEAVRECLSN